MKKDFILTFITEFIVILCMLATYKMADSFFGQKGFTDYSLARRVVAMLQPVFLVGMHITIPRQVAFYLTESKQKSSEILLSAVIILISVTLVLISVMVLFKQQLSALLFDNASYARFIFPLALALAGMAIHSAVYGYYRGMRQMRKANLIQLLIMGIIPLLAISLAAGVAESFIIAGVLWIIISIFFLLGIIFKLQFSFSSVRKNIRNTFNHGIQRLPADLGIAALLALPVLFFTHAFGTTQSGYLAFSISLLTMTGAALKPIGLIMLPHATTLIAEKNYPVLHRQIKKMIFYFLLLSAIVIAGYELLAPVLLSVYLGKVNVNLLYISRMVMLAAAGYMFYVFFRSIIDAAHHRSYNTVNILISLLFLLIFSMPGIFFHVNRAYLLSIFALSVSLLGIMTYLQIKKIISQA
jgi:O-antigen/teichoic acid export membrane protein